MYPGLLTDEEYIIKEYKKSISAVFIHVRTARQSFDLLEDLLTPVEFKELALRWQILKKLAQKIPQREIAAELKVSSSKITRGSRLLANPRAEIWKFL